MAVPANNPPNFTRIGKTFTRIAKYESIAIFFAIIVIMGFFLIGYMIDSMMVLLIFCIGVLVPIIILFIAVQLFTRDLIVAMETLGSSNNIPQFVRFSRFLYTSIVVGLIAFIWIILCTIIMVTPYFFAFFISDQITTMNTVYTSEVGEITLTIVTIVIGMVFIPHAYKSWKYIDDYFIILHDPWPRDVGILGVKKILDASKVALVTIFLAVPAIAGYMLVLIMLPFIVINVLVACGKYIQGLYRVGEAFIRVQTMTLYMSSAYHPADSSQGRPVQTTPPSIIRYQPSQAFFNAGAGTTRAQSMPPQVSNPAMMADNTVTRDLLERSSVFRQMIRDDPSEASGQESSPPGILTNQVNTPRISAPANENASTPEPRPSFKGKKCKYCLADLPELPVARCPSCNGILLDIGTNSQ